MKTNLPCFPFGRFGPLVNPIGEYVRLDLPSTGIMLGEIVSVYRDDARGLTHAVVKHFNGEPWPIEPALSALGWIRQDA